MKKMRFFISSLASAGIAPFPAAHAVDDGATSPTGGLAPDRTVLVQKFAQEHRFTLAQHRSHSSHSSHSSHRSGSSGRTRAPVYTPSPIRPPTVRTAPSTAPAPSRNERSTPPSSVLPSSPAIAPNTFFTPPAASEIQSIVRQVQLGLKAYGYYEGDIDGLVGSNTRDALRRFQTDFNLKVTGTITPEVLDAFKITAQ